MHHFYDINHFHFFDATTIVCMLPPLSLALLIFAVAFIRKYGDMLFLIRPTVAAENLNVIENSKDGFPSIEFFVKDNSLHWSPRLLGVKLAIILLCFVLANSVAAYCLWRFNYYQFTQGETFREFLLHALKPMVSSLLLSIICTLPVFWLFELTYYRQILSVANNSRLQERIFVNSCLFAAFLFWLVPLVQAIIVLCGFQSGDLDLLKDLFRIGLISSSIPMVIAGLRIVCDAGNISYDYFVRTIRAVKSLIFR